MQHVVAVAVKSIAAFLINLYVIFYYSYELSIQLRRSLLMNLYCFEMEMHVDLNLFTLIKCRSFQQTVFRLERFAFYQN